MSVDRETEKPGMAGRSTHEHAIAKHTTASICQSGAKAVLTRMLQAAYCVLLHWNDERNVASALGGQDSLA